MIAFRHGSVLSLSSKLKIQEACATKEEEEEEDEEEEEGEEGEEAEIRDDRVRQVKMLAGYSRWRKRAPRVNTT